MIHREETIGDCRLILGDCRDILPTLGPVDAVVTDPPYGVAASVRSGLRKEYGAARKSKSDYRGAFFDNPEYVESVVVPALVLARSLASRMVLTPGLRCLSLYPRPDHIGSLQYPGSTVMSCWGPMLWQPILYYGRDPHQGRLVPDSRPNCNDVDRETAHPCAKPLKQWTWVVRRASIEGETILDPFAGSGTTGVACVNLGRSFIGIEREPAYFDIAVRRIADAYKQPRLFAEPVAKPVQSKLFGDAA